MKLMSIVYEQLEATALTLSRQEKAALALALINDLESAEDPNVEQLWIAEIESRLAAYEAGSLKTIPGAKAFAEIRRLLK